MLIKLLVEQSLAQRRANHHSPPPGTRPGCGCAYAFACLCVHAGRSFSLCCSITQFQLPSSCPRAVVGKTQRTKCRRGCTRTLCECIGSTRAVMCAVCIDCAGLVRACAWTVARRLHVNFDSGVVHGDAQAMMEARRSHRGCHPSSSWRDRCVPGERVAGVPPDRKATVCCLVHSPSGVSQALCLDRATPKHAPAPCAPTWNAVCQGALDQKGDARTSNTHVEPTEKAHRVSDRPIHTASRSNLLLATAAKKMPNAWHKSKQLPKLGKTHFLQKGCKMT